MRVSGAQALASLGIDLYKIELLARWRSPMIFHYARNAPTRAITQNVRDLTEKATLEQVVKNLAVKLDTLMDQVTELSRDQQASKPGERSTSPPEPPPAAIRNVKSQVVY